MEGRAITPKGGPDNGLGSVIVNASQNTIYTLENVPLEMEANKKPSAA